MRSRTNFSAGFTLVELLIGMSLALTVMTAVLTSYIFLGRNLLRLANQQTIETESRRALAYFSRDVRMATGISGTPSATSVTLTIPTATSTTTVVYSYNSSAGTLTRTPASGTGLVLLNNITGLTFSYYDSSGNSYTSFSDYLIGIKQLAVTFTCQKGTAGNGTQTRSYEFTSPRLVVRNHALLQ